MALIEHPITGDLKDALKGSSLIGEVTLSPYGTHDARVDGADALLGPIRYAIADIPDPLNVSEGGWVISIRSTGRVNGDQQFKTITRTLELTGPLTWGEIVAGAVSSPPMTPTLVEEAQAAAAEAEMWASTAQGVQDTAVTTLVNDPASATSGALSATYETLATFNVKTYGATGDGITDDSAAVQAAIQAAYDAGGGTIFLPRGVYRCNTKLTFPNDGATPRAGQPSIQLRGVGAGNSGDLAAALGDARYLQGSVLDLRSTATPAKIDTRGFGLLSIEGITITDQGTSSTPFLQSTNTTLHIRGNAFVGNPSKLGPTCDQDAIVLGGGLATTGNDADSAFFGYGTVIDGNHFHRIRRGVFIRANGNSNVIQNNVWTLGCGASSAYGAIHIDGDVGEADKNLIIGNTVEIGNYVYAFKVVQSAENKFVQNSIWDEHAGVGGAGAPVFVAALRTEGAFAGNNEIDGIGFGGVSSAATKIHSTDGLSGGQMIRQGKFHYDGLVMAGGADKNFVRPDKATGAESSRIFAAFRSALEATRAGLVVLGLRQDGLLTLNGTNSGVQFQNADTSIGYIGPVGTSNYTIARYSAGNIDISPFAGGKARVTSGVFVFPTYTTATRPSASTSGQGAAYYDTTLGKPVYSDGTSWRDGAGTVV